MGKVIEKIVPIQTHGVPFYTIVSDGTSLRITNTFNAGIDVTYNHANGNGIRFADPIWYFDVGLTETYLTQNSGYVFVMVLVLKFLDNTTCTKTFTFGDDLFGTSLGAFSNGFSSGFLV